MEYLVDTVATQHPDATVEFSDMAFVSKSIHGALKRLLPPKRVKEVRAEREENRANPEYEALYLFVARTMRDQGNTANSALFIPQISTIMGFLNYMGVDRLGVNDELINQAITAHESHGDEGLQELFRNISASNEETSEMAVDESAE